VKVFLEQARHDRVLFSGYNRLSESLGQRIEAVLLGKSRQVGAKRPSG